MKRQMASRSLPEIGKPFDACRDREAIHECPVTCRVNKLAMTEGIHQGDMCCTLRKKTCCLHVETLRVSNLLSLLEEGCFTAQQLMKEYANQDCNIIGVFGEAFSSEKYHLELSLGGI